jgi:hypothetical protein
MKTNKITLTGVTITALLAVCLTLQLSTIAQPPPGLGGPGVGAPPPGGPGPGGPGGPGRRSFGPPPRPGQILPEMLQNRLKLTDAQKVQIAKLQKEVDAKLAKILTSDQNKQLEEIKARGPGRGPGGPGRGPGGPGGPPGAGGPGN